MTSSNRYYGTSSYVAFISRSIKSCKPSKYFHTAFSEAHFISGFTIQS